MIQRLSHFFTSLSQRWLPDAFIFAIVLTLLVLVAGVIGEGRSPLQMTRYWGDGFWNLLTFSMQVVFTLISGSVLARTELVGSGVRGLARRVKTPAQAIVVMTAIALVFCWINWGFGLIASALLAREIARQVKGVHYPLLLASAYSGLLVWHAGLSGTIPLKVAVNEGGTLGNILNGTTIPLSETIFSWPVLLTCGFLLITLPIVNRLMIPAPEDTVEFNDRDNDIQLSLEPAQTPAEKMEQSRVLTLTIGLLCAVYIADYISDGEPIGLNMVNLCFLCLGLLLHRSPAHFLFALKSSVQSVGAVILQFPLYAGIMGMMISSGLAASMSEWFVDIANADTFTFLTFLSAGLVNFFVPSGGGQWAVQAPVVIPAAEALGVPLNKVVMAVVFGDAWTNMIQPLWALPLLGVAGLTIKDIMGYCTVALIWSGIVFGGAILILM